MTRAKKDKLYRSFNKGLITEAGFLTYPEDASIDELNTVLQKGGNRRRRRGIGYEPGSSRVVFPHTVSKTSVTSEYFWRAAGNDSASNFVVLQINRRLYFFDTSVEPLSDGIKSFTINLNSFASPTALFSDIAETPVQMSGGKGFLFVAQEHIDPFTIEYFPETDTIVATRIYILIRDFDGVYDGLANDTEPSSLSSEHYYNLRNQGWVVPGSPSVQTTIPTTPIDQPDPTVDEDGTTVPGEPGNVGEPPEWKQVGYDPYTGKYNNYGP